MEGSNLVRHARRELAMLGEDAETTEGLVKVIQTFADMHPSGGMASIFIPMINELLQFHNLTPLTDNPDEWALVNLQISDLDDNIWQNIRRSEAFSNDGGKTYYLLSEGGNDQHREPLHNSEPYLKGDDNGKRES
jgi:hypothetical protein